MLEIPRSYIQHTCYNSAEIQLGKWEPVSKQTKIELGNIIQLPEWVIQRIYDG